MIFPVHVDLTLAWKEQLESKRPLESNRPFRPLISKLK